MTGVHSLVPDFAQASRIAIEHLSQLGHQQLGIISGPFGATSPQLVALNHGVRVACDELGISLDAQNIAYGDLSEKAGELGLEELLTRRSELTAVFCLSDAAAAGALTRAHAKGLRIPEDISIIGCSDDACTRYLEPNLTTVHLPAEEMGAAAVTQIENLIRVNALQPPAKTVLPATLSARGSTAAPRPR
jgi:DNA-binding LacI/PurR family transcriptional regulator